jgi:hypothetical protein
MICKRFVEDLKEGIKSQQEEEMKQRNLCWKTKVELLSEIIDYIDFVAFEYLMEEKQNEKDEKSS